MNRLPGIRDPWAPRPTEEAEFGFITDIVGGLIGGLTGGGKAKEEKKSKEPDRPEIAGASFAPWALMVGGFLTLALILGRPRG